VIRYVRFFILLISLLLYPFFSWFLLIFLMKYFPSIEKYYFSIDVIFYFFIFIFFFSKDKFSYLLGFLYSLCVSALYLSTYKITEGETVVYMHILSPMISFGMFFLFYLDKRLMAICLVTFTLIFIFFNKNQSKSISSRKICLYLNNEIELLSDFLSEKNIKYTINEKCVYIDDPSEKDMYMLDHMLMKINNNRSYRGL
jgi:hypothetical protein